VSRNTALQTSSGQSPVQGQIQILEIVGERTICFHYPRFIELLPSSCPIDDVVLSKRESG
jgi:hypothetical protein